MFTRTVRPLAMAVALATATGACLGGGGRRPSVTGRPPAPSPSEAALMGQWELVSIDSPGQSMPASGGLSFDQFNNISVRAELPPDAPEVNPPRVVLLDFSAKAVLSGDQITYVGLQRRAPPEQMVPSAADPSQWRHFAVEGDTLRIWYTSDNGQVRTLTFRRSG